MRRSILLACLIIVSICAVSQQSPASAAAAHPMKIKSFEADLWNCRQRGDDQGRQFGHALAVTFNGTVATVISDKNSTIKVDVPAGATTGYIEATQIRGSALSLFALHGRRGLVVHDHLSNQPEHR